MTPTTIPSVFPVPSSITKSEPTPEARGPAIFCLTSSGTVSGTRNFFAGREALAGCRGAALTRGNCDSVACDGITIAHPVPIFSPERWQSIGSSAPLTPPQERTVSRRRRETTKCASALNTRMIFGTAATQNSGERTANHFAVFVPQPFRAIDKLAVQKTHEVRTYTNFTSFRLSCDLRYSKNRETAGIFGTGCVIVIPSHATLSQLPLVRAAPRHPRHRTRDTLKRHTRVFGNQQTKGMVCVASSARNALKTLLSALKRKNGQILACF